jgi:glycosyltransferase involved in cell wall biosynthesis
MLRLHGCFVIGFIGRLIDRKGIGELFEAFEKMYAENEKIRLLLVGPVEAEQVSDKTLMSRIHVHPGVVVAGMQRNVPLYLSVMDLFVLPAWWEGFGNVLIQAAAMGVPVISTNATGTKDAVSNGFNGLLVEPKSVDDLVAAMQKLIDNTEMRTRMGENGIQWARNFQSHVIWDEMNQLYLQ